MAGPPTRRTGHIRKLSPRHCSETNSGQLACSNSEPAAHQEMRRGGYCTENKMVRPTRKKKAGCIPNDAAGNFGCRRSGIMGTKTGGSNKTGRLRPRDTTGHPMMLGHCRENKCGPAVSPRR
jgi:hypothetical protein